jgi:hypothetical protein
MTVALQFDDIIPPCELGPGPPAKKTRGATPSGAIITLPGDLLAQGHSPKGVSMQFDVMPPSIASLLHQPELRLLLAGLDVLTDRALPESFILSGRAQITFGAPTLSPSAETLFTLRQALELGWLSQVAEPAIAGLAAARCAALAVALETDAGTGISLPAWVAPMAGHAAPELTLARLIWARLAPHQPGADAAILTPEAYGRLIEAWPLIGPTEWLMEQGGDARLATDPVSGLNGYGCSHRPRPWAVTFASSTASSSSARGYLGAEDARRRMIAASFDTSRHEAVSDEAARVRQALVTHFMLPPETAVILAASGTDSELIALALAQAAEDRPITNILLAPEETGSGVPLAARGRHFAADTARGVLVPKGETIAGFRDDTVLHPVSVRALDGSVRPAAAVDAECVAAVSAAISAGRRPILHVLDVSKTGLRAPSRGCVAQLQAQFGMQMDVIVDACQTRLNPGTVRDYLGRGWIVLITGSKFFTGPPFSGAVLAPRPVASRLQHSPLPQGLSQYSGRPEWPSDHHGVDAMLPDGNHGLCMRWQAALAEMQAFAEVPGERRRAVLHRFVAHVDQCIAERQPILLAVNRSAAGENADDWDATETIRCFAMVDEDGAFLDLAAARKVYIWLNADLCAALDDVVPAEARDGLRRKCHIGQPVAVSIGGLPAAVLRVSAGARLVSGEPAMAHLHPDVRLERELSDVSLLFAKLTLILAHFDRLTEANPRPTYS